MMDNKYQIIFKYTKFRWLFLITFLPLIISLCVLGFIFETLTNGCEFILDLLQDFNKKLWKWEKLKKQETEGKGKQNE